MITITASGPVNITANGITVTATGATISIDDQAPVRADIADLKAALTLQTQHLEADIVTQQEAVALLTSKVTDVKTVDDSIITLVQGLSQQLRDMAAGNVSPEALVALADQLEADNQSIRDAVLANTPAAP